MKILKAAGLVTVLALAVFAVTCGKDDCSPTSPSSSASANLTAPAIDSPSDDSQLDTLRPTLTVRNGTSDQTSGSRTYDFQVSDKSDFTAAPAVTNAGFAIVVNKTGVPESSSGKTSYTLEADLQPSTLYYWRARVTQGSSSSAWSSTSRFKSKIAGYNRAGELYDPLTSGETIGTAVGSTTFVTGKGIRLNDQLAYVKYTLAQPLSSGEFSVEVEGLYANGPGAKLKVLSMMDGGSNLYTSPYMLNVQYRGVNGNPTNAISFKALYGGDSYKFEPDLGTRQASVVSLDASRTYFWKVLWGNPFRLIVLDGGVSGSTIYDRSVSTSGTYSPNPHIAYLGANLPTLQEEGSWPGAIYRNVFIGNTTRPASLGSALGPER